MIFSKKPEVVPEHLTDEEKKEIRIKSRMALTWLGIVSIIMMFSGLTSGYIVRMDEGDWVRFEMPSVFYISTAVILLSSLAMNYAMQNVKKGNLQGLKTGVLITLTLGFIFTLTQWLGWVDLVRNGIHFVGNPSGSFFYVLTGLHLVHLLVGIISLIVVSINAGNKKYTSENYLGLRICALYWHFLGVLWIYLFLFLLYVK